MLTPYKQKTLEDDVEVLAGLAEVHSDACGTRDFRLCDRIRVAIDFHLNQRTGWIKIESGLNLSGKLDF